MSSADLTMDKIVTAVTLGRAGDVDSARRGLLDLWDEVGVAGDPFHRCTLAHYLADLQDDPAEALIWDVRALDAAGELTDERAQQHHASLQVAGFYPSLYLNIADNLRRLGSFQAAAEYIEKAHERVLILPDDSYGRMIRSAVTGVRQAIDDQDTAARTSAPGAAG